MIKTGWISRAKGVSGLLAAAGLLVWAAVAASAAEFEFRLGHPLQPTDATQTAMVSFADAVKKRTDGRVEIEVFPADQLGNQKEVGEMLVQGANVMQFTDYLFLAEWVPDAGILQAPFLLNNLDDWYKLADSPWMVDLEKRLQQKGIFVLSHNNYFGSRSIIGPKPIQSPSDISGQTIREAAAPMYVKMAESWGARPVVMAFAEVYTGLSQGVVDFVECPPQTMVSSKFTELRKVVSLTNHMVNWNPVIVNDAAFHAMPEDLQKIVQEEAVNAGNLVTKLKRDSDTAIIEKLKGMGITVVQDIDRAAFRSASAKAYEAFPEWTPGLADTVRGVLDKQ
jgi:tripartite ATP-independent transporter DctP family solute receptor